MLLLVIEQKNEGYKMTKQETKFTKFNLSIHQLLNSDNQDCIMRHLIDISAKESLSLGEKIILKHIHKFIAQLKLESLKIEYAVNQIEEKIESGNTLNF